MDVSFQASQRFTRISSRPSPNCMRKKPQESMSSLLNLALKKTCLQSPWTIVLCKLIKFCSKQTWSNKVCFTFLAWKMIRCGYYCFDISPSLIYPKKISRLSFSNVNALQWLLKVKIQCKFLLWIHLYLCKSSLYVYIDI